MTYIGRGSKWGCPYTIIKYRPTLAKKIARLFQKELIFIIKYKYEAYQDIRRIT